MKNAWYEIIQTKNRRGKNLYEKYHLDFDKEITKHKKSQGKKFTVLLTHDVDKIYPSIKYKIYIFIKQLLKGNINKSIKALFNSKKNYWTFHQIQELEDKYGAKSTWFFLTAKKDIQELLNPLGQINYKIEDKKLKEEIRKIIQNKNEIGLHTGYYSFKDVNEIKKEKKRLEQTIGEKIIGIRNHYLMFDIKNTWNAQTKAGFLYDSTLGYTNRIGTITGKYESFETNKISPESKLLEIPLNIMDKNITNINDKELKQIINTVADEKGVLVINFHNSIFDINLYPKMDHKYELLLKEAKKRNAWMPTMKEYYNFIKSK